MDALRERFYRAVDQAEQDRNTARKLARDGRSADALQYRNPSSMLNGISQGLATLRKRRSQLESQAAGQPPTEREATLKEIAALTRQEKDVLQRAGQALDRFGPRYAK
jgi:hypothetical protein